MQKSSGIAIDDTDVSELTYLHHPFEFTVETPDEIYLGTSEQNLLQDLCQVALAQEKELPNFQIS